MCKEREECLEIQGREFSHVYSIDGLRSLGISVGVGGMWESLPESKTPVDYTLIHNAGLGIARVRPMSGSIESAIRYQTDKSKTKSEDVGTLTWTS